MKIKHILVLFAIGYCIDIIGTWQKILHTANADFLLTVAVFVKLISILLFILKLLKHEKGKDFLNW